MGEKIAILGYGSQGRAQALNLRDSGFNVVIGNTRDSYASTAESDGFRVSSFEEAAENATVLMILLPDHLHESVWRDVRPRVASNALILVAHGFSHYHSRIDADKDQYDHAMLAPRMPGRPIRDLYAKGGGAPAFFDIISDKSGSCLDKVLRIAGGLGFDKGGLYKIDFVQETEIDLFVEQYFLPKIFGLIETSFEFLVEQDFDRRVAVLELFASGELGDLLTAAAKKGLYKTWLDHASPTCRFGIVDNLDRVVDSERERELMLDTLNRIRSKEFESRLVEEADRGFSGVCSHETSKIKNLMSQTILSLQKNGLNNAE